MVVTNSPRIQILIVISMTSTFFLVNSVHVIEIPNTVQKYDVDNIGLTTDSPLLNITATSAEEHEYELDENEQNYTSKTNRRVQNVTSKTNRRVQIFTPPSDNKIVKHPCQRSCDDNNYMICQYDFVVEHYSVMSKACFDCPYNKTHCNSKNCIAADGVKRSILVVNRQMPGPAIEVCHGDLIEVKVTNKLLDTSTTIHWHGVLQRETPFMDGVPFVSQCPIGPQAYFLYRFYADTEGTHIWHAHSAFQRGDGVYGALVVRVPSIRNPHLKLYDFDHSEHVLTVMDWEHTFSVDKFTLHMHAEGDNKPPSLLVNGKGRFQKFPDGKNILYTPLEKFTVKQGYRYRFRLINSGFLNCPIEMSVDYHNITLIAADGENIKPVEAQSLLSLAGERFDFVIEANQEIKNYWIRFKGILDCSPKGAYQVAILHYEGAEEDKEPEDVVTYETAGRKGLQINKVNTPIGVEDSILISELSSIETTDADPALKAVPDFKFYIPFDFYPLDNSHFQYAPTYSHYTFSESQRILTPQMNHISMEFPSFALMTDIERSRSLRFCNGTSISMECLYKYCECIHVLQVTLNAVVEIILIDEGKPYDANHPFHLHGYKFRVLGMDRLGNNTTEGEVRRLDIEKGLKRNFVNPPIKDTVTTPDGGYTILRFHATNPGFWIFHCHIDFHIEMGMALLFKVGDDSTYIPPPKNFPTCGDYGAPYPTIENDQAYFIPKRTNERITYDREYYSIHTSCASCITYNYYFGFFALVLIIMQLVKANCKVT